MQPRRFGSKLPGQQTGPAQTSKFTRTRQSPGKPSGNKLKLAMLALIPVMIIAIIILIANKPEPTKTEKITCPLCQHTIEKKPGEIKDAVFIKCDSCHEEFVVDAKKAHIEANKYLYKGERIYHEALEASDPAQKKRLSGEANNNLGEAIRIYNLIEKAGGETAIREDKRKAVNIRKDIRTHRTRR